MTSKPLATISYNTKAFLDNKLAELMESDKLLGFMYITHKGEDGDKDHSHLLTLPNGKIDPSKLRKEFNEPVIDNEKPLGCLNFAPSKIEDWLLYAVHYKPYLEAKYKDKDEAEKLPYELTDIVVSDGLDLDRLWREALDYFEGDPVQAKKARLLALKDGASIEELYLKSDGKISIFELRALKQSLDDDQKGYAKLKREYDDLAKMFTGLEVALIKAGIRPEYDLENHCYILGETQKTPTEAKLAPVDEEEDSVIQLQFPLSPHSSIEELAD